MSTGPSKLELFNQYELLLIEEETCTLHNNNDGMHITKLDYAYVELDYPFIGMSFVEIQEKQISNADLLKHVAINCKGVSK